MDAELTEARGDGFILYDDHPMVAQEEEDWRQTDDPAERITNLEHLDEELER